MIKSLLRPRFLLIGLAMVALVFSATVFAHPIGATSTAVTNRHDRTQSFQSQTLRQRIAAHQLASTVQVLSSEAPSVIIQFPLFPSGVKKAFPKATGVVTIVQGNPEVSLIDSVTVDVSGMPADTTFTIFFIELA